MKIFMGLIEVSGYYNNLKKAFDELGVESTFINFLDHPFKYGEGDVNLWTRIIKFSIQKQYSTPRWNLVGRLWWIAAQWIAHTLLFLWAFATHDAFIFGFKSTFFAFKELPLLKLFNKKIIYVFHGTDGRPPYLGRAAQQSLPWEEILQQAKKMKAELDIIDRYADFIVDNPVTTHFHERPIVIVQIIGVPLKSPDVRGSPEPVSTAGRIRILHCPSAPRLKGTPQIRQAICNLQAKGHPIDFIEIVDKPNVEVLKEMARCDFVVDQLNSDTPMSTIVTEAAFFGKATLIGLHTTDALESSGAENFPLTHRCYGSETVESAIEKLIVDEAYRLEVGKQAQQFVRSQWTFKKVAERYVRLIEGDVPDHWMYDPKDLRYVYGWGPEDSIKQAVRDLIEYGGVAALQLSDKPELEKRFIEFAGLDSAVLATPELS